MYTRCLDVAALLTEFFFNGTPCTTPWPRPRAQKPAHRMPLRRSQPPSHAAYQSSCTGRCSRSCRRSRRRRWPGPYRGSILLAVAVRGTGTERGKSAPRSWGMGAPGPGCSWQAAGHRRAGQRRQPEWRRRGRRGQRASCCWDEVKVRVRVRVVGCRARSRTGGVMVKMKTKPKTMMSCS